MGTTKEMAEKAFDVYNSGDLDRFVELYTEDAVLNFADESLQGRDAIRRSWAEQWAGFPDSHVTSDLLVEEGDTIADEFTYSGTNTGPIAMPDGTSRPATGKHFEVKAMQLLKMRDGKIVRHDIFMDNMTFMTGLGLVQGPTATA